MQLNWTYSFSRRLLICSCAILKYLCARYHLADHWYPADIKCRARVDEFLFWSMAHLHPCSSNIYNHQVLNTVLLLQSYDVSQKYRRFVPVTEAALPRWMGH